MLAETLEYLTSDTAQTVTLTSLATAFATLIPKLGRLLKSSADATAELARTVRLANGVLLKADAWLGRELKGKGAKLHESGEDIVLRGIEADLPDEDIASQIADLGDTLVGEEARKMARARDIYLRVRRKSA